MKNPSGFWAFLAKIMNNEYRDSFAVRLGSTLLLNKFAITGPLASFVGIFVRGALGLLIETGIFRIDLLLDAYREGVKLKEFEKEARIAYDKARAKIYDEDKKNEIRQQYLEIISRIGTVGNGPRP